MRQAKQLDIYLKQMDNLLKDVKSDIYGSANNSNRQLAERVEEILQYFLTLMLKRI